MVAALGSHCRQAKALVQQLAEAKRWEECYVLVRAGANAVSPFVVSVRSV